MSVNISQLAEASQIADSDLLHLRTQAGIDKKIQKSSFSGFELTTPSVAVGDIVYRGIGGFKKRVINPVNLIINDAYVFLGDRFRSVFINSTTIIHAYKLSTNIKMVAGVIQSDGSISYGSAVSFAAGADNMHFTLNLCRLSDSSFIVQYSDNGIMKIYTVLGNTISDPGGNALGSGSKGHNSVHRISDTEVMDIHRNSSEYLEARVWTISGYNFSIGTITVRAAAIAAGVFAAQRDDDQIWVIFDSNSTIIYLTQVTDVAGTPTWNGLAVTFTGSTADFIRKIVPISFNDVVAIFTRTNPIRIVAQGIKLDAIGTTNMNNGEECIPLAEIDGNYAIGALGCQGIEAAHLGNGFILFVYNDFSGNSLKLMVKLLKYADGNVASFAPGVMLREIGYTITNTPYCSIEAGYDQAVVSYIDLLDSGYLKSILLDIPSIMGVAATAGTTPKIINSGVRGGFSSLTPGCRYYISPRGELTKEAWSNEAYLGTAISATEILIRH